MLSYSEMGEVPNVHPMMDGTDSESDSDSDRTISDDEEYQMRREADREAMPPPPVRENVRRAYEENQRLEREYAEKRRRIKEQAAANKRARTGLLMMQLAPEHREPFEDSRVRRQRYLSVMDEANQRLGR